MKKPKRKPHWFEPNQPKLDPAYKDQPTGFETDTIFDYAFWLTDDQRRDIALHAVVEADLKGSTRPITALRKSGRTISEWGQSLIADYQARNQKKKRGPKAIPIYARSTQEAKRMLALERARLLLDQQRGRTSRRRSSEDDPFEQAAREYGMRVKTLHGFKLGKLGSSNRMKSKRDAIKKTK